MVFKHGRTLYFKPKYCMLFNIFVIIVVSSWFSCRSGRCIFLEEDQVVVAAVSVDSQPSR